MGKHPTQTRGKRLTLTLNPSPIKGEGHYFRITWPTRNLMAVSLPFMGCLGEVRKGINECRPVSQGKSIFGGCVFQHDVPLRPHCLILLRPAFRDFLNDGRICSCKEYVFRQQLPHFAKQA